MHVLILGGGGREHALTWKIAQSSEVLRLSVAPGNPGIARTASCVDLPIEDAEAVAEWAKAEAVDLVVVGPEAPLAAGVADEVREAGIPVFGPSAAAAQLESSKAFTKEICDACDAPTAAWERYTNLNKAITCVREVGAPIVIKADGLAAGKGVVVAQTEAEAEAALEDIFGGSLGEAGSAVVIEEFMPGEEASFFVLTDGETVIPLATAQDHKRVGEGDTGPNTGGMGAYSPAPVMTADVIDAALDDIVCPTIAEMGRRGMPYRGVLYAGLMIENGRPRLVEYNVRFGDPECQVLMMRLASDIVPALMACATGGLDQVRLQWRDAAAITVVMAANGYPGAYEKGTAISGLEAAGSVEGVNIFHAGTRQGDGGLEAAGGRVLNVSALGSDLAEAAARAYQAVDRIDWPDGFCRRDIGWRVLGRR